MVEVKNPLFLSRYATFIFCLCIKRHIQLFSSHCIIRSRLLRQRSASAPSVPSHLHERRKKSISRPGFSTPLSPRNKTSRQSFTQAPRASAAHSQEPERVVQNPLYQRQVLFNHSCSQVTPTRHVVCKYVVSICFCNMNDIW